MSFIDKLFIEEQSAMNYAKSRGSNYRRIKTRNDPWNISAPESLPTGASDDRRYGEAIDTSSKDTRSGEAKGPRPSSDLSSIEKEYPDGIPDGHAVVHNPKTNNWEVEKFSDGSSTGGLISFSVSNAGALKDTMSGEDATPQQLKASGQGIKAINTVTKELDNTNIGSIANQVPVGNLESAQGFAKAVAIVTNKKKQEGVKDIATKGTPENVNRNQVGNIFNILAKPIAAILPALASILESIAKGVKLAVQSFTDFLRGAEQKMAPSPDSVSKAFVMEQATVMGFLKSVAPGIIMNFAFFLGGVVILNYLQKKRKNRQAFILEHVVKETLFRVKFVTEQNNNSGGILSGMLKILLWPFKKIFSLVGETINDVMKEPTFMNSVFFVMTMYFALNLIDQLADIMAAFTIASGIGAANAVISIEKSRDEGDN